MKVLWFCNMPVCEAYELYGLKKTPFGGWLEGLALALLRNGGVDLTIAFCGQTQKTDFRSGVGIDYVMYSKQGDLRQSIPTILQRVQPDVVHIHGAEFEQHNSILPFLNLDKTLVSIQGLKSYCSHSSILGVDPEYWHRVPFSVVGYSRGSIWNMRKHLVKTGATELDTLKKVKHVIGRTTWDYACAVQANSEVIYHYNRENLRDVFYSDAWNVDRCEKHSIFVSQMGSPIKGGHYMLKALAILKEKYPDVHLYVAGGALLPGRGFRSKMKTSAYGLYLSKLIKKYDLSNHITFTGLLTDSQMKERMLKSNVFVSPSNIENSPNSLGEAMLLGMPCVSSCVGGVQDMLTDREEGYLYPVGEFYMLAHYIDRVFSDPTAAAKKGEKARRHALVTHDKQANAAMLLNIYEEVCGYADEPNN